MASKEGAIEAPTGSALRSAADAAEPTAKPPFMPGTIALAWTATPGEPRRPSRLSDTSTRSTQTVHPPLNLGYTYTSNASSGNIAPIAQLAVQPGTATPSSRRPSWCSGCVVDTPSVGPRRPSIVAVSENDSKQPARPPFRMGEIRMAGKESLWRMLLRRRAVLGGGLGRVVDSKAMTIISVFFTVYALFGDDFRLATTDKPADNWFNGLCLFCLAFFFLEIFLKCMAQSDYFLGFFFILDLVATVSLVLDLTWVSDAMFQNSLSNQGSQARSGRTARVAASLGRVVRVLRLVRVFKLYKAYYEKRNLREGELRSGPGSDRPADEWDVDCHAEEDSEDNDESLVGKKLVALTTRKVILLVLLMLLVLPLLDVTSEALFNASSTWGADSVLEAFKLFRAGNQSHEVYEEALLKYIYYHHWYDGRIGCSDSRSCATDFYGHVFWVGFAGATLDRLQALAAQAQIAPDTVVRWETLLQTVTYRYSMSPMPAQVRQVLTSPWQQACDYGGVPHLGFSLLSNVIPGVVDTPIGCPGELRGTERFKETPQLVTSAEFSDWQFAFFFDIRPYVKQESVLGIVTTIFICVVLSGASAMFSADATNLVLAPIERMITKVNKIRDDPLQAIKMADAQFQVEEVAKHRNQRRVSRMNENTHEPILHTIAREAWYKTKAFVEWLFQTQDEGVAETAVLEKTIIKLGSLLALGFGHAGVNIVSKNMSALDSAGVNAMIEGVCVDCIVGFARVRHFSSATEVLQTKIMTFVNQIAEIVHGLVTEYHGAANKNNGDTFLIIWRAQDYGPESRSRLADMSVIAFARILGQVHMSPVLARYRSHPGIQQRLGSACRVDMTFGLHLGWAIEGAVGTDFKIDASYISPNVSIAEALERATQVYGVHFIASELVVMACTNDVGSCCRLIDQAMVGGSKAPMGIYAFDLDPLCLEVEESVPIPWSVRQRFRARQGLEVEKQRKWGDYNLLYEADEVALMRARYTVEFFQLFNMGYQNYSEGEWQVARRMLEGTRTMLGGVEDGPSKAILAYMEKDRFEAPSHWNGVRDLEGAAPAVEAG